MWLLAPGAALKWRPGWHLFYFNARWVGKHFFIMGGGFELCMVGADFFFFLLVVGLEKNCPPPHMVNSGTTLSNCSQQYILKHIYKLDSVNQFISTSTRFGIFMRTECFL